MCENFGGMKTVGGKNSKDPLSGQKFLIINDYV